jgi:hypothetical protein
VFRHDRLTTEHNKQQRQQQQQHFFFNITSKQTIGNDNCIHEEIKGRLNSGKTYYHSVYNFCFPIYYLEQASSTFYMVQATLAYMWAT